MRKLGKEDYARAEKAMMTYARPLERAIYECHFRNGSKTEVLEQIKSFQNPDGGFGNGLESDFRLPDSSPLATSVGLRLLSEVEELEGSSAAIQSAIRYLESSFDDERNGWYAVSEKVNDFPHAPWWNFDRSTGMTAIDRSWGNPSAELIGYLIKYGEHVSRLDPEKLAGYAIDNLESRSKYESEHEIYCYVRLYDALSGSKKERLGRVIETAAGQLVHYDKGDWDSYVPQPVNFARGPGKDRFGIPESQIERNIDHMIGRIEHDGMAPPLWGDSLYQGDLKPAYSEWIGVVTLEALLLLDNYGRIEGREH